MNRLAEIAMTELDVPPTWLVRMLCGISKEEWELALGYQVVHAVHHSVFAELFGMYLRKRKTSVSASSAQRCLELYRYCASSLAEEDARFR